jgi:hypothetical protein
LTKINVLEVVVHCSKTKELKISGLHKEGLDKLFYFISFGILIFTDCFVNITFFLSVSLPDYFSRRLKPRIDGGVTVVREKIFATLKVGK